MRRERDALATARAKAHTKSDEQARHGNLPYLVERDVDAEIWHVLSRTIGGLVYEVVIGYDADGPTTIDCDCPATRHCWHQTHAARAARGDIGMIDSTRGRSYNGRKGAR
jgi:hypothetical protein